MTIRNKIRIILFTAIIGLILILGAVYQSLNQIEKINEKVLHVVEASQKGDQIVSAMNSARKNDMEFIRTLNLQYITEAEAAISQLKTNAEVIRLLVPLETIEQTTETLSRRADLYVVQLHDLVEKQLELDLKNEAGLSTALSAEANRLQEIVIEVDNVELINEMYKMRLLEKEYILNPTQENGQAVSRFISELQNTIKNLDAITPSQKEEIEKSLSGYYGKLNLLIKNYSEIQSNIKTFETVNEYMDAGVLDIQAVLTEQQDVIFQEKERTLGLLYLVLIGLGVVVLAILVTLGLLISRSIISSVNRLQLGAEKFGEGDFTYRVDDRAKDEMGELAKHFNFMVENVQSAFLEVRQATYQLSDHSQTLVSISEETTAQTEEVNVSIRHVAAGAEQQQGALKESTALMDELIKKIVSVKDRKSVV